MYTSKGVAAPVSCRSMAPSRNSPRRFEPEIYMAKAEQDIRRVQIACSLAEPPWDGRYLIKRMAVIHAPSLLSESVASAGFCGLVQVSEEDTQPAEEYLESPRQVWSDASSSVAQESGRLDSSPSLLPVVWSVELQWSPVLASRWARRHITLRCQRPWQRSYGWRLQLHSSDAHCIAFRKKYRYGE